jgi:hypothetical protein
MAKRRKKSGGNCKRVRICGKSRVICRNRKGQITSNRKG